MARIGQIIDDKYEILKEIGRGGMSRVYLAMDKRLNKQWAVKEIDKRARDANNEIVIQSAIDEAHLIKQLDHPSIVRIVDIIETADVIYIIEDYIEGETLSSVLENNGAQPQELVIEWAMQICEALEYLHTRTPAIIYRDMKPANVMLKPDGNIKIIDFGIARQYKEQSLADTISLGTRGYAAPEQFGGHGQTTPRTDIYCLGATLYHLVTGKSPCEPPYEILPIRHWNPQLSAGLEVIIQKCTQLNPDDRYQSCAELLYALSHYEEYSAAYRAKQQTKLNAFIAAVAAFVVFLGVGIVGQVMKVQTNNANYSVKISDAEKATDVEEKVMLYAAAIDIKPEEQEAYRGLINAFKEREDANLDPEFTTEEEKILKQKVTANLSTLQKQDEYAELAFEIGKLYWYYYDYGKNAATDNQLTRMKNAVPWFEDVLEYGSESDDFYVMAKVYSEIGKFNQDITLNVEEASDKGLYAPYWDNIKELVGLISGNNESEIVQLEVYRLVVYSIETYARKFNADGVTEADMRELFDEVKYEIWDFAATTEKTETLKAAVFERLDYAEEAIENAYRE